MADGVPDTSRRPRPVAAERRMSDVEAMMWTVEKDPFLSSVFGSLTVLDRPPDPDRLTARFVAMADNVPRLRQRVVPGFGRFAPPQWQDDPDFDLAYHVRRVALPSPGSERQLRELATRFVQDPLERTRPLWAYLIVEGLAGGRGALVQKTHHTITDGVGGVRMAEQFVDLTRDAPPPPAPRRPAGDGSGRDGLLDGVGATVVEGLRRGAGVVRWAGEQSLRTARHPERLLALPGDVIGATRSSLRQVIVLDEAHSPLWTRRSLLRQFETFDVDFAEVHAAARALGGSVNDLFVTAAAGGAGAYHRARGAAVSQLRMAMPVSLRTDASAGGNRFAPTRTLVPAGIEDPRERFCAVHALLDRTRHERALDFADAFAGVANLLPTSVLVRATRRQAETVDFTTSNVRAAPFELFIGGARIDATYALGPLAGTAFNLTMMSYNGTLNLGVHVDRAAVDDPAQLRDCLVDSFAEVLAAA